MIKDNCFVFEFAPDRALKVLAKTAHLSHQAGTVNSTETKKLMEKLLQFCPVIAINGSQMNAYDVQMMIKQLKSAYIDDIVDSGFENKRIYNLEQLKLENIDLKDFENCGNILKGASQTKNSKLVKVTESDLDKKDGGTTTIKSKQQKTPEQKEKEKEAKNAIRILNAIITKVPLMVYGLTLDESKEITYDNFTDLIDDASWNEFMPKDATKAKFKLFKKYIDTEMFELCNEELRNQVNAANKLSINERIKRLTPLFLKFRNPDKETVLTPWRVVNMHLGDCLGGYNFYNENYSVVLDEPRFIDHGQVTNQVLKNKEAKILEINSKTGLYPLYVTYSLFRARLNSPLENRTDRNIWKETVEKNIFVVCRTKMAEAITKRTLVGNDKNTKVNVMTIENMIEDLKTKPDDVVSKILNKTEWNIQDGGKMKFDAVVGNPPYQENLENRSEQPPVYHLFYNIAFNLSKKVTLITPARFLFNAGKTPKEWNEKVLSDPHFKVVDYIANSKDIFPTVEIKGGVSITYRDEDQSFGAIGLYVKNEILNNILSKVKTITNEYLDSIIYSNTSYKYSKKLFEEHPDFATRVSGGSSRYLSSSVFDKLSEMFFDNPRDNNEKYIKIIGRQNSHRVEYYTKLKYLIPPQNFDKYKVFISSSNGTGEFGEILTMPFLGEPNVGATETFVSIGDFNKKSDAENLIKYIKSKFARTLLGTLKVTQGNKNSWVWSNIPLQDFTDKSDIDWSKPVAEIDQQLYKKYNLTQEEIDFIEKSIKPME